MSTLGSINMKSNLKYITLKATSSMYIYSIAKYRVSLVYTNLSKFDCETSYFIAYVNHARIRS